MALMYQTISEITDFGPCITKIILPVSEMIDEAAISCDTFSIYIEKKDPKTGRIFQIKKSFESDELISMKGCRKVVAAYPSDGAGNRVLSGNFITLELEYGPMDPLSSELSYIHPVNIYALSDFRITQIKEIKTANSTLTGLVYTLSSGTLREQTNGWINSVSSHPDIPLRYGYYKPETRKNKCPLIIWLHGAGEGGEDPTLAYTGNKVVSLSSEKIQKFFGSAYVLAPQSPTMWMDDGSGQYTKNGKSKYTAALKYLIDEFVTSVKDIDKSRIYIGGCSNGGFMTMRMIIDYPNLFAAAYPVCEALFDECITDKDIDTIKNTPIWFTHTKNDPVVKPDVTVLPTYERLIKAGAGNIHLSYFDKVIDTSGKYYDDNGNPYEYHGHFSWIYTLNNECTLGFNGFPVTLNGKAVTLFEWLSMQSL